MLVGTAWTSRVGTDTAYLTGIALPMPLVAPVTNATLSAKRLMGAAAP